MKDLFQRLPWLPWGGGLAVLGVALVLLRGLLGLSLVLVLLLLLIAGLLVALVLLVQRLRQEGAADEIERTISTQADADIERSTAGQLAEMQQLKEELLEAIAQLKSSGRRAGADALATLPWYMVLGPAGAGKSELIKRSGLEFPRRESTGDPRAVRGVGGTRRFSWWLSNDAVLLDMAGKTLATAAFDDSGDWLAFLETLRKQRPGKPIQGALVMVALDQIADQPEARVDSVARATRERVEELIQQLGVVFPVYVIFNRLDRVSGFAEFFEDLAADERREPWGATLSMERARAQSAEELFDEEFGVLLGALSERRMPRMSAMGDSAARARAFAFPLQLERVRDNLRRFLRTLFDVQASEEPPLFRGFYFTAAAQEGDPVDRVLQPAVRSLGLTLQRPEATPATRGNAWFVRDLFTEVIFPDATLAVTSRGAVGRLRRSESAQLAAWGLALLLVTALFAGFSCSNGGVVGRARRAGVEVANRVTDESALVDNLRTLDRLREAADQLDRIHRHVPFSRRVGAWAGGVTRDPAVELWMRKTAQFVVKPAVERMETALRARAAGQAGTCFEDYERFRAWRLLTHPQDMDAEDEAVLSREVTLSLQDRLALGGADANGRREYPELVRRQMEFLSRNSRDFAAIVHEYVDGPDRELLTSMMAIVHGEWSPDGFYADLLQRAGATAPVRFSDLAGSTPLMNGGTEVPGAFSRDGFEKSVRPLTAWYGRLVKRDALLAESFGGRSPDLENDLLRLYAADVTKHWVAFLEGVEYAPQVTVEGIADQLARLTKGGSPIFRLLRGVRDQTKPIALAGTPLEAVGRDFRLLDEFFAPPGSWSDRARSYMGEVTRRVPGLGGGPTTLRQSWDAQYMQFLVKAQADLVKLGPAAPIAAIQSLLSPPPDQTNGVFELVSWADGLGASYGDSPAGPAVARLLRAPVDAARRLVGANFKSRLGAPWRSMFLDRFQKDLSSKYPFAGGGADASLDDFATCFGPQGYFWAFYQQYLASSLSEDGTPKSADAGVSPEMVGFLKKAYVIRQAFFGNAGPKLDFTVSTTPPLHDPSVLVRWVAFDCGGGNVTYTMGPPHEESLRWPGEDKSGDAQIRVLAAPPETGKKRKKHEPDTIPVEPAAGAGTWGLFRLIDRASESSSSGGTASLTWTLLASNGSRIRVTWDLKTSTSESPLARGFMRLQPPASP